MFPVTTSDGWHVSALYRWFWDTDTSVLRQGVIVNKTAAKAIGWDAKETDSLGFRFVKDNVASEIAAVDMVVAEMALPLMLGQVNPDDRAQGVQALKEALQDAGINEIIAEVQKQYKAWKASK